MTDDMQGKDWDAYEAHLNRQLIARNRRGRLVIMGWMIVAVAVMFAAALYALRDVVLL